MNNKIYTISEISKIIKKTLEENPAFNNIWIKGEISNIIYHSSGHIYLTLKDENAVITGVFFKYANKSLSFKLEDGMSVLAFGAVNVFEKRGSYQFIISQIRLEGIGELLKRIEQLKKKLAAEGIFDPAQKKKLPYLPKRIGVVTSPTGAAVRDIIKVALRRFPNIEIIVAPAKVQGEGAPESIAKAIAELNNPKWGIDVIIAGRGGGSFEDLMPFNEEIVVRAFHKSRVPIISAVGHQIDHPLCDEAADVFAPTPSAAAEMVIPVKDELIDYIFYLRGRAYSALLSRSRELSARIEGIKNLRVFRNPREIIYNRELILSDIEKRLISLMKDRIVESRNRLLQIPDLGRLAKNLLKDKHHHYNIALQAMENLSPIAVMKRGFSIAKKESGEIIKNIDSVDIAEKINLFIHEGLIKCTVDSKHRGVKLGKEETD